MSLGDAVSVALVLAALTVCACIVVSAIEAFRQAEHKRTLEREAAVRENLVALRRELEN